MVQMAIVVFNVFLGISLCPLHSAARISTARISTPQIKEVFLVILICPEKYSIIQ